MKCKFFCRNEMSSFYCFFSPNCLDSSRARVNERQRALLLFRPHLCTYFAAVVVGSTWLCGGLYRRIRESSVPVVTECRLLSGDVRFSLHVWPASGRLFRAVWELDGVGFSVTFLELDLGSVPLVDCFNPASLQFFSAQIGK